MCSHRMRKHRIKIASFWRSVVSHIFWTRACSFFHSLRIHVYYIAIYRAHAVYDNEKAKMSSSVAIANASLLLCSFALCFSVSIPIVAWCRLIMHATHVHTIQMQLITTNKTLKHFRLSYIPGRRSALIAELASGLFFPSHIWFR